MSVKDYTVKDVRSAALLTNSYVAGTTLDEAQEYNQLNILIDFTIGDLTSAEIKIEYSNDDSTYYQETFQAIAAGTATESLGEHTFTATGSYIIQVSTKYRFIKISAKGTGTVDDSSLEIKAILGNV